MESDPIFDSRRITELIFVAADVPVDEKEARL